MASWLHDLAMLFGRTFGLWPASGYKALMIQASQPSDVILSVVIISFNTCEMTLACLASVFEQTQTPFEVIVVDNASTDGSAKAIAEMFPQVRLLAETRNHGFAPAHDIAVPLTSGEWLLLLNPDTIVLEGALDKLLAFAQQRPSAGIWGGRTVFADKSLNPASCWNRMTLWSTICRTMGLSGLFPRSMVFNSEAIGGWLRDSEREVDVVTGCLFLIQRATWDRLGGFERTFTMYGEEVDLCLRARKIGVRPRITPDATIVHYGAASDTVRPDKMVRLMRAKVELIKRHFSPHTRLIGRHVFRLWPLSRYIALRVLAVLPWGSDKRSKATAWSEIWNRRKEWQDGF
jgi:GT2 family glycosyltransferase